ncbi:MAG: sel1 repeat family protein, partial [Muribaculaceae bacterium]|nr:sel1 repeat family protein [Muribaculaceae bacterium]
YCYENGVVLPFDRDRALTLYMHSAESGYAPAQTNLGILYYKGSLRLVKSPEMAFEWFCRAAEGGDDAAMFNLYKCFYDGIGTEQDKDAAAIWLKNSADRGNEQAIALLNKMK